VVITFIIPYKARSIPSSFVLSKPFSTASYPRT
jgi:hypothetical protein